jgi:hypothetical protein
MAALAGAVLPVSCAEPAPPPAVAIALSYRSSEPLADTASWRLLFEVPASAALRAGQLTNVRLAVADRAELPAQACALDAKGRARVWLHD